MNEMRISDFTHDEIDHALSAYLATLAATIVALDSAPRKLRTGRSFLGNMGSHLHDTIRRQGLPARVGDIAGGFQKVVETLYRENS